MFDVFDCLSHKFICVSIIYFLNNQSLVSSVANTFGGGQKEKKTTVHVPPMRLDFPLANGPSAMDRT